MKKLLLLLALCVLALLAACGGGTSPNTTTNGSPTAVATNSVSIATIQSPALPTPQSSAAPATASSEPTRVFAAGADPQTVVKAFFDAVNAKQTDAALALADGQIFFAIGNNHGTSKDDLRTFLAKNTLTYTITNIVFTNTTDSVTLAVQVSDGTTLRGAVSVEDGKITTLLMGS